MATTNELPTIIDAASQYLTDHGYDTDVCSDTIGGYDLVALKDDGDWMVTIIAADRPEGVSLRIMMQSDEIRATITVPLADLESPNQIVDILAEDEAVA